MAAELQQEG